MTAYDDRQDARRERLEDRAERLHTEAGARLTRAHDLAQMIPFGQPILVDHYSAPRHRAHVRKIDNNMRKGIDASRAAEDLDRRAEAVGRAGIASDDPNAPDKLEARVATLVAALERMKQANKVIRKHAAGGVDAQRVALVAVGFTEAQAADMLTPDCFGNLGFASFTITNRGANIRRLQKRLAALARVADVTIDRTGDGWAMWLDVDAGRVFLRFDERCDKPTYDLVRGYGFVWARSCDSFVRKDTPNARHAAPRLADYLDNNERETP